MSAPMPKTWPIIEHDQNRGLERIFDVVTADHAEDLTVGGEVVVVCTDHDGTAARHLGFGYAFVATVTEVTPMENPGLFLVRAEVKPAVS